MDTGNQPWLNDLPDDDWFPSPTTPTTPPPPRPVNDSRPSGVQNSPSRIPVPARRPPERSPDEGKKRITRPCHFIKREPPTPKRQSPKTPRKWRSPVPDKSKKSPKPSPAAARKQQPPAQAGSPLRSVSNASSQPGQQDTVQVRPKNDREGETTPEWRRRLVQGGIPSGEQRDLFAPVGLDKLESVFKPPSPGSETAQHGKIPMAKQSDDIQSGGEDPVEAHDRNQNTHTAERGDDDDPFENLSNPNTIPGATNKGTASSLDLPKTTREMRKAAYQNRSNEGLSKNDMRPRTASGLEDLRNEGITPITFSRPGTVNGKATSEIIQSAIKQVTNKLGNLSLDHDERPDSRMSDSVLFYQQSDPHADVPPQDELLDTTGHSWPQDLSMGTQESGRRRVSSNFRRGQHLSESSFRRDLTPSSFPSRHLSPAALSNSRIRSSPPSFQRARSADPPSLPRWSSNVRTSVAEDPEASKADVMPSSGSPLKLFGDHDTFTNNKLLRRMSQFEEILGDSPEDEPVSPSEEARRKGASRGFLNVAHNTKSEQSLRSERPRSRNGMNHRISRFGDGQLDNFDFSDTSPYEPKLVYDEFSNDSIPLPSRPRTSDGRQDRRHSSYRNYTLGSTSTRSSTGRNAWSGGHRPATSDAVASHRDPTSREGLRYRETERSFNSPKAYPTPKRRRTVLRAASTNKENLAFGDSPAQFSDDMSLLQKSLVQQGMDRDDGMQSSLRPQSAQQPRAPTPSQHKSSEVEGGSPNQNRSKSGSNDRRAPEFLSERKPVPKVKVTGANEERRKGSITTQDFLSEATKIMDVIRSKGKNAGGLPSLEELAMEGENSADGYEDESTLDEFVRPPSREGVDVRKLREPKAPDPRVLSHLRKFQENEDLEFGASASFCLDKVHNTEAKDDISNPERERDVMGTILHDLRIPENAMDARKRKYSVPFASEDDSKNLSARSIPTGSSQSSHAKGVLSSDLVSHLIPEQVNGLTYDRFKNLWVKERARRSRGTPKTDDSEDDPFNGIPDLSVDELQEMMGIQPFDSPQKGNSTEAEGDFSNRSNASTRASTARPDPRPQARDGEQSVNGSSVQSKPTRYTSSVANSGTRATSWSSDRSKRKGSSSENENEIQLHEGRFSRPPKPDNDNQQARVVTVSFSSPLVSQTAHSDDPSSAKVGSQPQSFNDGTKEPEVRAREGSYRHRSSKPFMIPSQRKSVRGQPFIRRPISRIDEGNEDAGDDLSLVRRDNMTPTLCTPIQNRSETSLVKSSARTKGYSFHLSPLGDFTVNQADQSLHLEMSYVAQRTHPSSLRQIHGTFALATEELVKHITSTEPFEPHWEHIRRLILREKGLITLHKLNWFCPRLEDLDVSYNDIGQVSGIPSSLRTLKIQRNCLSSLTAWGHLMNLQYLDVSGNALESLDGFSSLIHLRELKANDNSIRNIDGVLGLNGLLSLKLRNNCLTSVDFEGADLARLSELDLSHNKLTSVRNVDSLPALATLSLSFNQVSNVGLSSALRSLRSLQISNNKLSTLDARMFPSLNLLYADQNSLSTILGLEHCRGLEILSAREQVAANEADCFDLDLGRSMDIRRVYLSSNRLSSKCLTPSVPLRSLQLFDVASCQIESLPGDFAVNFPNVQVLNLNFNSLAGIEEIAFMNCLARLNVAGNRIHRMRRLCQVLSKLGRTAKGMDCSLHRVDIRGNPLTVRFYPPPVTGSGRTGSQKLQASEHHNHNPPTKPGVDIPSALADLRPSENTNIPHPATWNRDDDEGDRDDITDDKHTRHISDPFTLPPADPDADKKYLANLDEPTRLRRRILELMLYAGSGGSVKYLDGKRLRPSFERESDMQHAWTRLEELGVLKKREHKKEKVNGKETEAETKTEKDGAPVAA